MTKSHLSLLMAVVIAIILVAGCTTQNQTSQGSNQTVSTNASTSSSTTTAVSSSVARASATPATPTPAPSASGTIATSIHLDSPPGDIKQGQSVSWNIEVTSSPKPMVCGNAATVSVLIDGKSVGHVTSGGLSDCFKTAYFELSGTETNGLSVGTTHTVTLHYAGDSTYQPSETTFNINVT